MYFITQYMAIGNIWKKGAQLFPFFILDTAMAFQVTSTYQQKTNSLCLRDNSALRGITKLKWKIKKKKWLKKLEK